MNRCQQLYAPPHGSLEPCSSLPGQTCEFSCNKGYILTGSTTRTCNSDGTWTGTPTQCNGNWPQLLSFSSKMILGDGLWGWVFWDGCILERTWLVSSCHQLQSFYSLIFLSRQKKKICQRFVSELSHLFLWLVVGSKKKDLPKHLHPFHIAYFPVLELRVHHSTALRE